MVGRIYKYTLLIALPSMAVYGVLLAVTFALYPRLKDDALDTNRAAETFLGTPPAYVTYSSSVFSRPGKALVLMGASNAKLGFLPDVIGDSLPGVTVHNASVDGTRIDGMSAIVDLVYARRATQIKDDVVFVFGVWYGQFKHAGRDVDGSRVAVQMRRFGLFRKTKDGYDAAVGPVLFDAAVKALSPFFWFRTSLHHPGSTGRRFAGMTRDTDQKSAPEWACDAGALRRFIDHHREYMPEVQPSQFLELVDITKKIRALGGKAVIVDLPQPRCFTAMSPEWKRYQEFKRPYLQQAVDNKAVYVDLQSLDDDNDFKDAAHPNPAGARKISRALGAALRDAELFADR